MVNIAIFEDHIQTKKCIIVKNSEEERKFLANLIKFFKELDMDYLLSKDDLKHTGQEVTDNTEKI